VGTCQYKKGRGYMLFASSSIWGRGCRSRGWDFECFKRTEVGTEAVVAAAVKVQEAREVVVLGYSKNMDRSRVRLPW
tara:strand:+ start:567 stop:797 length:231 start_codon:yes stop_codon:yes gene_type:complete